MENNNKNKSAFPIPQYGIIGLTKREYFTAMAMQGKLAGMNPNHETVIPDILASESVKIADAVLKELDK